MPRGSGRGRKKVARGGLPRVDIETLREAVGEKVFARGVDYYENGQVEIVAVESQRVIAQVLGSELYHAELSVGGDAPAGHCSCPAFEDWGFCKHLVATALAANEIEPGELERAASRLTAIRDHLHGQGIEALIEIIMGLAERDPALLRSLELAAAASDADDERLLARFRKALAEATRTGEFIGYREARAWAQEIEDVLDQIESLVDGDRAGIALRLLDHFFTLIEDARGSVDDSDGHCGGLVERARSIHLEACRKVQPDPVELARELFAREMGSDWDSFYGASAIYHDVLGTAGLAEYRRLAEAAWGRIKPLHGGDQRIHDDQFSERFRLMQMLEDFAMEEGDVDACIEIRSKDLSSPYRYLGIAELCLAHGRELEALKWAEEGLWLFESQPDDRLTARVADLYRRQGRNEDAERLLWLAFERRPSLDAYERLKAGAGKDEATVKAIVEKAIEFLKSRVAEADRKPPKQWRVYGDYPMQRGELLVGVLLSERRFAEAWEIVRRFGCGDQLLKSLAEASEAAHPAETVNAYGELVERQLRLGGNQAYEQACAMIERMQTIRKRLGEDAAHAAYLDDLTSRHKAKRNFMKLLRAQS